MFKMTIFTLSFVLLFTSACSALKLPTTKAADNTSKHNSLKAFPAEDLYIVYALRAEEIGDSVASVKLFQTLYDKSQKKEYLYKVLTNKLALKDNQNVIDTVDKITHGSLDDYKLLRLKIIALYQLQRYKESENLAVVLVDKSQMTSDYLLLSDIYIKEEKYDLALKYLEEAYVKEYDEKILDRMSIILFVNLHRPQDAIAQLETHSRMRGCSELICNRLIGFYSKENNVDGIVSTYKRMYATHPSDALAKKIIQVYGYRKEYAKMISFLEKYNVNQETLLQLYAATKNYKKAFVLADKLYVKSGDIMFLGQSAIFEYESTTKQDNPKLLQSVIKKLETVVKKDKNPLYENYLGYVLIDHDIDIKRGMQHIRNVLKVQPDSAYYLDSLAWGYFKLHQCDKAKKIMDKVVTLEGGDDPEVLVHVKSINNCSKGKK